MRPKMAIEISGKRSLAKLNAFDLVVTVALGSTIALLSKLDRLGAYDVVVLAPNGDEWIAAEAPRRLCQP
jgi:hypothetical protein